MRHSVQQLVARFALLGSRSSFVATGKGAKLQLKKQKIQNLDEKIATCEQVSAFLLATLRKWNIDSLTIEEFQEVQRIVDGHYVYVKKVTREKGIPHETIAFLRAQTLSLKLGGKIPIEWLLQEDHAFFRQFILRNHYQHAFFTLRLQLPFDYQKGPSIPVYRKLFGLTWIFFGEIEVISDEQKGCLTYLFRGEELFTSSTEYVLGEDYSCFYNGIQKYNIHRSEKWLPYDKRNPEEWENTYQLEVWTSCLKKQKDHPSMLRYTHAYVVLRDRNGYVRSVGQDVLIEAKGYKKTELFSHKPGYGKITTPDWYVWYPTNSRHFWHVVIKISKEQHDRIIAIVEKDKQDRQRKMSLTKNNCVSYTLKLLREGLGLEVNASIHGIHVVLKNVLPDKWYHKGVRRFFHWCAQQPTWVQRSLHFFPLYYLCYLIIATGVSMMQRNSYLKGRDHNLRELFLQPWSLQVDHPLALHRSLEAYADEKGEIHLSG